MTTQPHLPLLVRITGDLDRDAAGDLAATLQVAGWEGASVMRPKHGAAEVRIAIAGRSDRDTMEELLSGIRGVAAGPGDDA